MGLYLDIENEEYLEIIKCDDKERFLKLLSVYPEDISMYILGDLARFRAKNCLLAFIQGDGCESAFELYPRLTSGDPQTPTPLASVTFSFPQASDIIALLLKRGPLHHANIKCKLHPSDVFVLCPLERLLFNFRQMPHLLPWDHSTSIIKLIILLCQWDTKSRLDCARLLVPHTYGIGDIAWTYVRDGNLVALAALLLLAPEKVLLAEVSGLPIRQRIMSMMHMLSDEDNLGKDGAIYNSMLTDAVYLIDIFKKAGGALSLYSSLMHEYVPPHKVLADVASLLKKAGYALEPRDLDLRDCYRDCPELRRPSVFKLSDPGSLNNNKYLSPSSLTRPQGFRAALQNYPYPGNCQLFNKLKSGPVLSFMHSASEPRLFNTAAGRVENGVPGILQKQLAYIASRLKRGIKF